MLDKLWGKLWAKLWGQSYGDTILNYSFGAQVFVFGVFEM